MVVRLAEAKARKVAEENSESLIIGSDQATECDGMILGKAGNLENARQQLRQMSGKAMVFHTGLCLLNSKTNDMQSDVIEYRVVFRYLEDEEIDRYLDEEKPFNCAGSFKSEALGVSLLEKMEGDDPSALIGLPLMLGEEFAGCGFELEEQGKEAVVRVYGYEKALAFRVAGNAIIGSYTSVLSQKGWWKHKVKKQRDGLYLLERMRREVEGKRIDLNFKYQRIKGISVPKTMGVLAIPTNNFRRATTVGVCDFSFRKVKAVAK